MIQQSKIEEIINAASIDQVIGDYIRLKKRGANLLGLCPFHSEKTPSFTVSLSKGIYKCFGCGKAGNVINFIMDHDSLGYIPALKFLAEKFNIEWPQQDFVNSDEAKLQQNERESLQILNHWANTYFQNNLFEVEEGKNIGLSYFEERNFGHDIIKKFQLGFALDSWNAFYDEARKNQFNEDILFSSGLIKKSEDGKIYDAYRGRVIFPVHNINGKVIAFAGRFLKQDTKSPKYVNSPETLLYYKSNELYGLHFAKNAIRQNDFTYLVEGYTDVISMHQAGVENVVASSGTSLTEGQIKLIKRFTENVTVLYDGDAAGIKASIRGIDMLLENGLNVKVLLFPDGEDPDSYSNKVGFEAFNDYLKTKAQDFIFFKSSLMLADAGKDPIKKAELTKDIVGSISKIPDAIKRAVYIKECSVLMRVDENILIAELNKLRKQFIIQTEKDQAFQATNESSLKEDLSEIYEQQSFDTQERDLIRLLLHYANKPIDGFMNAAHYLLDEINKDEIEISHPIVDEILSTFKVAIEEKTIPEQSHFTQHSNPLVSALAADVLSVKHEVSPVWEKRYDMQMDEPGSNYKSDIDSALLHLKIRHIDKLLSENQKELGKDLDDENLLLHQHLHIHLLQRRTQLTIKIGTVIVR